MRIVVDYPPMFDRIVKAFPDAAKRGVVFTWGDAIYNPSAKPLPPAIIAHENVHCQRQGKHDGAIMAWWERYLVDPAFRLAEELPAHKAEFAALCNETRNRNVRHAHVQHVAAKLAAPLYGGLITQRAAVRQLLA